MKDEKDLGADAAAGATAEPVASDQLSHAVRPVHLITAWSGVEADESPLCGVDKNGDAWGERTIFTGSVTCPACLAAHSSLMRHPYRRLPRAVEGFEECCADCGEQPDHAHHAMRRTTSISIKSHGPGKPFTVCRNCGHDEGSKRSA